MDLERNPASALRILLFDPNVATAQLFAAALKAAGFQSTLASSLRELGALLPQGYDALVIDAAAFPEETGTFLRTHAPSQPTLVLTGVHALDLNANDVHALPRPISGTELVDALQALGVRPNTIEPAQANADILRVQLHALPADGVVELLANGRQSGALHWENDGEQLTLSLAHGRLIAADCRHSTRADLRLGTFVRKTGTVDDETLRDTAAQALDDTRLGERLVAHGLLSSRTLQQLLVEQAQAALAVVVAARSGTLRFEHEETAAPTFLEDCPELRSALLAALRQALDEAATQHALPHVDTRFVRLPRAIAKAGRHAFSTEELEVLEHLTGRASLRDVAERTRMGAHDVAKTIVRLRRAGFVRLASAPALSRLDV